MNKKMKLVIELEINHDNLDDIVDQLKDFAKLVETNSQIIHSALDEDPKEVSVGGVVKNRDEDRITGAFTIVPGDIDLRFKAAGLGTRDTPFGNIEDIIDDLEKVQ